MAVSTIKMSPLFVVENKVISFGQAKNNIDYMQTLDVTKDGYTAIGVVGWWMTGTYNTHFHVSMLNVVNNILTAGVRANSTTFTSDGLSLVTQVLYLKN